MRYTIAIIYILFISCNSINNDSFNEIESCYFDSIKSNDISLQNPKAGEWLYEHKESGQTFEEYKKSYPIKSSDTAFVIYLRPIGNFSILQNKALEITREYLEIFYQQKTILLEPISDTIIPISAKRITESEQILATYILDSILRGTMPKNGIVLMAISEKDLYPKPEWNYVFGLASYSERIGVSSIYRLQNTNLDSTNFTLCLSRLINVSSHEIGHMFSMSHCTFAKCTMNGSNSLSETDSAPNRLCSECQKKMYWNFKYDYKKRQKELTAFFKKHTIEGALILSKKDMEKTVSF